MNKRTHWLSKVNKFGSIDQVIPEGTELIPGNAEKLKAYADEMGIPAAPHRVGWMKESITGRYSPQFDGIIVNESDAIYFLRPEPHEELAESDIESDNPDFSDYFEDYSKDVPNYPKELMREAWEHSIKKHGLAWRWIKGIEFRLDFPEVLEKAATDYLSSFGSAYQYQF